MLITTPVALYKLNFSLPKEVRNLIPKSYEVHFQLNDTKCKL